MSHEIFHPQIFPPGTRAWERGYATMALFRYLRPIDSALNPQGPLSHSVPSVVMSEVNREVKKAETRTKKRGSYLSFTAEKAQVAKYVASHARLESEALHLDRTRTPRTCTCVSIKGQIIYVIRDRNPGPTKFKTTKKFF